mmetsp:Transcript_42367/g.70661  ORF Transcript_42367/g.70661 Transcript_42367/m.70661 type:complete len:809 (+) Transcript_42367:116-2542(+)
MGARKIRPPSLLQATATFLSQIHHLSPAKKWTLGLVLAVAIRKYQKLLAQSAPASQEAMVDRVDNLSAEDMDSEEDEAISQGDKKQAGGGKSVSSSSNKEKKKLRAILDSQFHMDLKRLLRIALRDWKSILKVCSFTGALFTRTQITMQMSNVLGVVTRNMIEKNRRGFQAAVFQLIVLSVPAAVINSLLSFLASSIATDMSNNLVKYLHDRYLTGITAYQVLRLNSSVTDVDQRITQDVEEWASSCVLIFQNLVKPGIDVMLYSRALARAVGMRGPLVMLGYFIISSILLRVLSPGFGKLTARLQKLMGFYRFLHMRFAARAEEIAFSYGTEWEKDTIEAAFHEHDAQRRFLQRQSFLMSILDNYIIKYGATVIGFAFVLSRIAFPDNDEVKVAAATSGHLTEKFVQSSRMLTTLSDAIGRIVLSYKQIAILAGFTSRVTTLVKCLDDRSRRDEDDNSIANNAADEKENKKKIRPLHISTDNIIFEDLKIRVPGSSDDQLLLSNLSGVIEKGMHTLIAGPNGCGKTCLLRVLRGLWPRAGGSIEKPSRFSNNSKHSGGGGAGIVYLPQMPYMPIGTLVDCIIYPDKKLRNQGKGSQGLSIAEIIRMADLTKVADREGLSITKQWDDILSGGESQKVAMARLYYHQPQFAVLDEATSMVSASLEPRLYQQLHDQGITVISIAHRVAVWKFHTHVLHFQGGRGGSFVATLKPLSPQIREELVAGYDLSAATSETTSTTLSSQIKDDDSKEKLSLQRNLFEKPIPRRHGNMRRAMSTADLREIPRHILRNAYIGNDWRKLLRREPDVKKI